MELLAMHIKWCDMQVLQAMYIQNFHDFHHLINAEAPIIFQGCHQGLENITESEFSLKYR